MGWFVFERLRLRYPGVVDGAYAASAPMLFYAQRVDQYAYYQRVTDSAERAVPGCADVSSQSGHSATQAGRQLNIDLGS